MERTLLDVVALLKQTISDDETAARKGFMQERDPRIKLVGIVIMLVAALFARSVFALAFIYAVTLAFAALSSVRVDFFLKRTLLFIPVFSLFIVVPAIFDFVTPGDPVATLTVFGFVFSVTRQGIDSACLFFMRVLASVSLTVLLALTTRRHVLLKVLRVFKVPQLFVMITGMTYRYIYLLLDIVQNMFIAVKSRIGYVTQAKTGRRIVSANMGHLWLQSYRLQTQVYYAMLSRGYTGEPKVLDDFHARPTDFIFLACTILLFTGTLWLNHCTH